MGKGLVGEPFQGKDGKDYRQIKIPNQDEQDKESGRYIRKERYAGACQRSFYVGEDVKQEDIKAEFVHGVLKLQIPKETPKLEQKSNQYITIEG